MKNILLLFTIVSFSFNINAQTLSDLLNKNKSGYKISGEVVGLQDSTVMLAYYFGGKQYATDTAKVVKGKFTFKGKKELKGGMYLIVLADQQYFDIIISDTHFSFKTDINDLVGAMSFKNSIENPPFYKYLTFISEMQKEVTPIREELETADDERKKMLQESVSKIDNKVKTFRTNFIKNNSNKFFSKIVLATTEIEIPESPLDSIGKPDKIFPYRFYKKHFWDYIDFSDERMLRTPIFYNKMDQYLEKLTAKHPDSINVSADILIEKSRANKEIFQYVVSYITSTYERSKIMGMDAVFVHMVEKYYMTGEAFWIGNNKINMTKRGGVWEIPCEINDLEANFIFDSGSSDVYISLDFFSVMIKQGSITEKDIIGEQKFMDASGNINKAIEFNIKKIKIGDVTLKDIKGSVSDNISTPLLLGQTALSKLGELKTDFDKGTFSFNNGDQLAKIADRAQKIAPNLIGRKASEFLDFYGRPFMKDVDGKLHTLQEVNSKYTLLVFFGPTCGHCKKELPKIKHTLDSLLSISIDIKTFAVATEFDKGEWEKFINDQNINDWLNVADINHDDEGNPVASSDWRDKYDIYSTPVIYLLDKDKKILAKRISHKQIAEIVGRLEQ